MVSGKEHVTPASDVVAKLADEGDRMSLLRAVLPRTPLGSLRIADTQKVGPANVDKCSMTVIIIIIDLV